DAELLDEVARPDADRALAGEEVLRVPAHPVLLGPEPRAEHPPELPPEITGGRGLSTVGVEVALVLEALRLAARSDALGRRGRLRVESLLGLEAILTARLELLAAPTRARVVAPDSTLRREERGRALLERAERGVRGGEVERLGVDERALRDGERVL